MMTICQSIKPADTLAYVVGASMAIQAKEFDAAKASYYKLISLNNKTKAVYKNLYYVVKEEQKNDAEAMKIIADARAVHPNDKDFLTQEINLYIAAGKSTEAIGRLNDAIKADPANAKVYLYNLGIIFKQTNDNVKAKEYFTQSLATDSLYEGTNYMMGFIYMDEGDVLNKKINNMNLKDYNATGKKEEAKRDALYKKAIPYLEKSYRENKDPKLKDQLTTLYKKFKMTEKEKNIQK